jgi:hypothetical protein
MLVIALLATTNFRVTDDDARASSKQALAAADQAANPDNVKDHLQPAVAPGLSPNRRAEICSYARM